MTIEDVCPWLGTDRLNSAVSAKGRRIFRLVGRSPKPLPISMTGENVLNGSEKPVVPVLPQLASRPTEAMNSCGASQKNINFSSVSRFPQPLPPGLSQVLP